MGLHIILCTLEKFKRGELRYAEKDDRFDATRYEGDTAFSDWIGQGEHGEFTSIEYNEWDVECYERPKDLNEARTWVKANVSADNQQRWLDLFDMLETDTEKYLWLQEIW